MAYTSIPDTTDTNYWTLKAVDNVKRMRIFVPRDRDLHKRLLKTQWDKIQSTLINKHRATTYKLIGGKD